MTTVTSSLIVRLVDAVSGPARAASASLRGINAAARGVARDSKAGNAVFSGMTTKILAFSAAAYGLQRALGSPIKAASEFESAMADVRKVVDFADLGEFRSFQKSILGMSKGLPVAAQGLSEIAAAAGQAGIAKNDILQFTEVAAKIGTAFDITAKESGDSLAKMMTAMGMTIPQVTLLADAMNHLSNTQASSAAGILDVVRRVGSDGKMFGFTAVQTSAFASAMLSAGAESDVAATSFRNMGRALVRGGNATKGQRTALDALGMDSVKVSKSMQKDAVGTTMKVLEAINKLPKHQQAATASMLFGDEARALMPLIANLGLLKSSLGLVADQTRYAGSAAREYEIRSQTFANSVQLFRNRFEGLKITIGNRLMPVMKQLMDFVGPMMERLANTFDTLDDRVGVFDNLKAAVSGFMNGLGLDGADLAKGFNGLLDLIFGKLSDFEKGTTRLGQIFKQFQEWGSAVRSFATGLTELGSSLANFFGTDLGTVGEYGAKFLLAMAGFRILASTLTKLGRALVTISGAKAAVEVLKALNDVGGGPAGDPGKKGPAPAAQGWLAWLAALAARRAGPALLVAESVGVFDPAPGSPEFKDMAERRQSDRDRMSSLWNRVTGETPAGDKDFTLGSRGRFTPEGEGGAQGGAFNSSAPFQQGFDRAMGQLPTAMDQSAAASAAGHSTAAAFGGAMTSELAQVEAELDAFVQRLTRKLSFSVTPSVNVRLPDLDRAMDGIHADIGIDGS
jgi:TP901 family phage tail tape measure protein